MDIRIHGGADEIGGNCIELDHGGQRIVLDLGRPLSAGRDDEVPLPGIAGLATGGDPTLLGVLISHGHQDHWGLMPQVHPDVPRYIGKAAADILRAAEFWGTGIDLAETGHLNHRQPFTLGPFTITPYLNDHSAFDAYSLLVEAGGERVFYTGDLRGHGRKAALFEQLLVDPPTGIDVLLCEGTNVRPEGEPTKPSRTETEVEAEIAETLRSTDGLAVVLSSPQNIDRLVTTYRAALRSGRELVVDLYGADIAAATGTASIPKLGPDWPKVHVYLPQAQRIRVKKSAQFDRAAAVKPYRVFDDQLAADPRRYVLFGSFTGELARLLKDGGPKLGAVIWSMWDGYLPEPSGQRLIALLAEHEVPLVQHHTSGHADTAALRRLIDALDPAKLIPIHTEHPEDRLWQI